MQRNLRPAKSISIVSEVVAAGVESIVQVPDAEEQRVIVVLSTTYANVKIKNICIFRSADVGVPTFSTETGSLRLHVSRKGCHKSG